MRSRAAALCFAVILILLLFNPALSIAGWKSVSSNGSMTVAIGDDGSLWTWGENSHGLGDGETSRSSPGRIGLDNDWEMGVAGSGTGYALKKNGSLWAWGYNSQGQLGDGTTTGRATIGQVGTDVDWESVSSAWTCTLAIKKDGTLWAWGYNRYGQFGNETTTDSSVPLQIGTDNDWKIISVGGIHAAGIKNNGTLWTWGDNTYGQLGIGTTDSSSVPVQVGADTNWAVAKAGTGVTAAIKNDGTLWAWGYNVNGDLGDGTTTNRTYPVQIGTDNDWKTVSISSLSFISQYGHIVASQYGHIVALKQNGTLWAWGNNDYGQLGDGTSDRRTTPIQIGTDTHWVSASASYLFTLALRDDNSLSSWGYNYWNWGTDDYGRLGNGTGGDRLYPSQTIPGSFKSIDAGASHAAAIGVDGRLWAWGANTSGQLGDGTQTYRQTPVPAGGDSDWSTVSAGAEHTIALKDNGTLWAWGDNTYAQTGTGALSDVKNPSQVGTGADWKAISAGTYHNIALKTNGTLWAWGRNDSGQTGAGSSSTYISPPSQIGSDSDWASIETSQSTSFAIKNNGTLWAWGSNINSILGSGIYLKSTPIQIGADSDWKAVAGASYKVAAIKSNGTLWSWNSSAGSPVQVGSDTDWINVFGGRNGIFALKGNGTLWAWGSSYSGEFGGGKRYSYPDSPVQVGDGGAWAVVSGGHYGSEGFTLGLKNDGTLWAWGSNWSGQLGDGLYNPQKIPTPVASASITINNGDSYTSGVSVDLSIECVSFAKGCHKMKLSDDGVNWSEPEPFSASKIWSLSEGDGTRTVYVKIQDVSGTWSGPYTDFIEYSSTVPVNTVYINSGAAYADSTDVTLSLACAGECAEMQFSNDGASWSAAEPFAASKAWTLSSGNGGKTVYARFKDSLGIWSSPYSASIYLDTVAPTGILFINGGSTATGLTAVSLTLSCYENCVEMQFSNDGVNWSVPEPFAYVKLWTLSSGDGDRTVYAKVKDGAGNWSAAMSDTISIDTAPPSCALSINNGAETVNSIGVPVTLSFSCSENCAEMKFSNDGVTWSDSVSYATQQSWSLQGPFDEVKTVYGMGKDEVGNWSAPCSDTVIAGSASGGSGGGGAGSSQLPQAWKAYGEWTYIAASSNMAAGIKSDGTLWTWGYNNREFDDSSYIRTSPVQVGWDTNWASVAIGDYEVSAIKTDGTLWRWGENPYVSGSYSKTPVQYGGDKDWAAVSSMYCHSLALKSDGTLYAWGYNSNGKLGDGSNTNRADPVQIGSDKWASVSAGGSHSAGIKKDGTLWIWGYNSAGQLGTGTTDSSTIPVQVGTGNNWAAVAAGENFTVAIKKDGTIWGWGNNTYGLLGSNNTNEYLPVQIGNENTWIKISAEDNHIIGTKNDGTLWAWGENNSGQLGDGAAYVKSASPVQISSGGHWQSVAAAVDRTYALRDDGTLLAWGDNGSGQLGNGMTAGTYSDQTFPTTVSSGYVNTNSGDSYTSADTVTLSLSCGLFWYGCSQMEFSNDNSTWSSAEPFSSTKQWQLSSGEGTKTVYVKFQDAYGTWSGPYTDSVIYSATAPAISIYINNKAVYTATANVNLTLSCAGCVEMQLSNDGVNWGASESFASTKPWTLSAGDGVKTVYAKFKDSSNTWSPIIANSIILDTVSPEGGITIESGTQYVNHTDVSVTVLCRDYCSAVRFSNDGTDWTDVEPGQSSVAWTLPDGDGAKTVYAMFRDQAGNWSSITYDSVTLDTIPPVCTVLIGDGAEKSALYIVYLKLSCDEGTCTEMQLSEDGSNWSTMAFSENSDWMSNWNGANEWTIYARVKDAAGNWSSACSDSILGPAYLTTPWPFTAVAGNGQVSLSWGDKSEISGLSNFLLYYSTTDYPSCPGLFGSNQPPLINLPKKGVLAYYGAGSSFIHTGLENGKTHYYILCIYYDTIGIYQSPTASATPTTVSTGFTVPSTDANTPGVEREDGQSEANNLDSATGKPKIDLQYDFTIILQDPNGLTPQYVKLYMAQREDPSITDFFGVDLACTGEWGSGATCSLSTLLGPSAYHKYYFEAKLADGAVMRYPESGTIDGPAVELLNGFNMVSVPRDLTGPVDGTGAFSSSSTYRWVSGGLTNGINSGGYVKVDSSNPIKPGEGYFVMREASTLPSLESYSDVQTETYEVSLTQGWNMVSNPYGGNVLLKDINVKNSSGSLKSWNGAVADEWVVNAVYYYAGSDWGSTYAYQAAGGDPEASLVPWLGYWVYVKSTSDTYTLVIPKP